MCIVSIYDIVIAMNITPEYLAGVMDSDGSISYTKKFSKERNKNYFVAQIQITWKLSKESRFFFDKLIERYGGSAFEGNAHSTFGKSRIIKYCATGNACSLICDDIIPHLFLKKRQAEIALEGSKLKSRKWGAKGKTDEVWAREAELFKESYELKHGK